MLTGARQWEFQNDGNGQAYQHHLDRWTPENTDATYPRLSVGTNINNNIASSFWIRPGDYQRIKNAEIASTLQNTWLGQLGINHVRLFVIGLTLATTPALKRTDPE